MITSNIVPQRPAPSPPYNQHQFNIPVVATNIASGECPGCNEHFAVSEKIYTEEEAAATGGNQATNVMQDAAPPPYEDCIRGPYNMQFQEDARTEDDITSQMSKFYVAYSYDHSEA